MAPELLPPSAGVARPNLTVFRLRLLACTLTGMLLPLLSACGGAECGDGTVERDGVCVPPSGAAAAVRCGEGTEVRDRTCVRVGETCGEGTVRSGDTCVRDPALCGDGTAWDDDAGACRSDTDTTCPPGTTWDSGEAACVADDALTCGAGTTRQGDLCVASDTPCPAGTVADGDACVIPDTICGTGTRRDPASGVCVPDTDDGLCGAGTRLDEATSRCVVDETACAEGTAFNETTGTCTPDARCRPGDEIVDGICTPPEGSIPRPELTWPGDGTPGLSPDARLVWQVPMGGPDGLETEVEVATDRAFSAPVFSTRTTGFDVRPDALDEERSYFWRVRHRVADDVGPWSEVRRWRTGRFAEERPIVYQLVVRHFGNTAGANVIDGTIETNGVGRFADIDERALAVLRAKGATHIWLTGVLRQATGTDWSELTPSLPADDPDLIKGRAGSFFAVRDYFDVAPDYAIDPERRLEEFAALVDRIHAADLRVMIDLVPNHVARSYDSVVRPEWNLGADDDPSRFFSSRNHFFYLQDDCALTLPASAWPFPGRDGRFAPEDGTPGRRVRVTGNNVASCSPSVNDWYETVKLNYGFDYTNGTRDFDPTPVTWEFMDEVIRYWQEEFDVDGFRVDFAHFVPTEFYAWAIARARSRDPQVVFMAEAYENLDGLLDAGFDAVYDDPTYDLLKGIYNGSHTKWELDAHFAGIAPERRGSYLRYLENHDERRIASPLVTGVEPDESGFGTTAAGRHFGPVSYLVGNGPVLFYSGQSVGETGAGVSGFSSDNGRTSIFDYWRVPALARWVNEGRFDGGQLTPEAAALHEYYRRLLHLAQHPAATGDGYWGLDFHNRERAEYPGGFYAFARFRPASGQLLLVVVNLTPDAAASGSVRFPTELIDAAGLGGSISATRVFAEDADTTARDAGTWSRAQLVDDGLPVEVGNQGTRVWILTRAD